MRDAIWDQHGVPKKCIELYSLVDSNEHPNDYAGPGGADDPLNKPRFQNATGDIEMGGSTPSR